MRRPTFQSSSKDGFTLLEIILATAIAAVVLIAVQTVFFGALRLRNTSSAKINADLLLQRTFGLVQADLSGLMLPTTNGVLAGSLQTTPTSSVGDEGLGQRISPDFYTTSGKVDGWSSYSEVQMVTYYLSPSTDGSSNKDLVRAVTRNLLPSQEATVEAQTLITSLQEAGFEFYDGTQWLDTWDSTQALTGSSTLPTAVRFRLVYPSAPGQPSRDPIETIVPILPSSVVTTTSTSTSSSTTP